MVELLRRGALAGALTVALAAAPAALADGTETLGDPSVPTATGTGVLVAGVGTHATAGPPASFSFNVPSGSSIKQVLLYWEGHATLFADQLCTGKLDPAVTINGNPVTGTKIGGETNFFQAEYFATYRSDITSLGLVSPGANTLTIADMHFEGCFPYPNGTNGNDGAGVVVIYDDGGPSTFAGLKDGQDLAFAGFAPPLNATVAQTLTFASAGADRPANLAVLAGSVVGPDLGGFRGNVIRGEFDTGESFSITNALQSQEGAEFDAENLAVTVPADATSLTVQVHSEGGETPASLAWIAAGLSIENPRRAAAGFLVIDEDGIDNGLRPNFFSARDVNDDLAEIGVRKPLRYFQGNLGKEITLHTGQVGDEGWFAPEFIPAKWNTAGPTTDGLRNFLLAGPGVGSRNRSGDREALLDKVPMVNPLRADGLKLLEGRTLCAVVYDSDISINYGPLNGSLKGANLGIVAFTVLSVDRLTGLSSSTLPKVSLRIEDAEEVCAGPVELFTDAPEPSSSSLPFDVAP